MLTDMLFKSVGVLFVVLSPGGEKSVSESEALTVLSEHDDIRIFTVTKTGENYYKSKAGRLDLYSEPKETDIERLRW